MAKRFRFSLQRVLDYRVQLEEQAAMELAKARKMYMDCVHQTECIRTMMDEHERKMYSGEYSSVDEIWLCRNYKARLAEDLEKAEMGMLEAAKEVNRKQRAATACSKDRKLLEKLKTNQAVEHYEEEKFQEQKEFDESATLRYKQPNY